MQHRLLFTLIFCNVYGIQLKFWRDVNRIENKKMKNWKKLEMENMNTSLSRGHYQGEKKMDAFQYILIFFSGPINKSSMLTPFFYTNHFIQTGLIGLFTKVACFLQNINWKNSGMENGLQYIHLYFFQLFGQANELFLSPQDKIY